MKPSLTALSLFAVSFGFAGVGACVGVVEDVAGGPGGTMGRGGQSGTSGGAGTSGAANTTGSAGTTGFGTGEAGTTGSSGTTGAAGTGTGTAGTLGTAGTTGRGGAAGTMSGGGTGGTGGTSDGNTVACTITAQASPGMIPTVGIVTFSVSGLTGITSAKIDFGPAGATPTMTAPVDLTQASYRTLLLGMKASASYAYRVTASGSEGTCTSPDFMIMTGAMPASVNKPTVTIMNAAAHAKGFIITSPGLGGTSTTILDADGTPVWWATGPSATSRSHMSWDGKEMYMLALNVQNGGGSVSKIGMDGSGAQNNLSGLASSHHDFTAIPGGIATMLWNKTGIDAPCSVVERAADGTMTTIVADVATLYASSNGYHSNAIHYYPSDDTYTISDRNPNLFVKITRKGQLIWQFGGTSPKDPTKFFSGSASWQVNHGHQLLADGTFLFFNNGSGGSSTMRVFKLDTTAMTATSSYMYTPAASMVLGDVQRLPNGNYLITSSTSGQITEITSAGQVVMTIKATSFGYSEFRESLYGPPPY
jgi:hypothetical protein